MHYVRGHLLFRTVVCGMTELGAPRCREGRAPESSREYLGIWGPPIKHSSSGDDSVSKRRKNCILKHQSRKCDPNSRSGFVQLGQKMQPGECRTGISSSPAFTTVSIRFLGIPAEVMLLADRRSGLVVVSGSHAPVRGRNEL